MVPPVTSLTASGTGVTAGSAGSFNVAYDATANSSLDITIAAGPTGSVLSTLTAVSGTPATATTAVSGGTVTLTAVANGTTDVTVTDADSGVSVVLHVTVTNKASPASPVEDSTLIDGLSDAKRARKASLKA